MDQTSRTGGLAEPKLLETIDKLFEFNIGDHIDLPQVRSCQAFNSRTSANPLGSLLL